MYQTSTGQYAPQTTPAQTLTDTRREMLEMYSQHGLALTPVKPRSRAAKLNGWPNRVLSQSEIQYYFIKSSYDIGIVCGERSGRLLVVDFDVADIFNEWAKDDPDRCATPHVKTARGYHVYYRVDDGEPLPSNGMIFYHGKQAGERKSTGGYVLGPPSVHPSGHIYKWIISPDELPFKVIKSITELGLSTNKPGNSRECAPIEFSKTKNVKNKQAYLDAIISVNIEQLENTTEGDRNNQLNRATGNIFRYTDNRAEVEPLLLQTALQIGLEERESIAAVESGYRWGRRNAVSLVESAQGVKSEQVGDKNKFESGTIEDILNTNYTDPPWIIPGIIPQGLTLLAGSPKVGKSWLALQIAGDFATGNPIFNEVACEKSRCLYLALEDNGRRVKNRLIKQCVTPTKLCHIYTEWEQGEAGLLELHEWMKHYLDTKLIIIDTLYKFNPPDDSNDYAENVRKLSNIKSFADQYNISVVVIHHTRKTFSDDFIHASLGSVGVTSTADTTIILSKKRGKNEGIMQFTGRDIEEKEKAMSFDTSTCRWSVLGDALDVLASQSRKDIIDLLTEEGRPMTPKEIACILDKNSETTRNLLWKMVKENQIIQPKTGLYSINQQTDEEVHDKGLFNE